LPCPMQSCEAVAVTGPFRDKKGLLDKEPFGRAVCLETVGMGKLMHSKGFSFGVLSIKERMTRCSGWT